MTDQMEFRSIIALFAVGMAVPVVVALPIHDVLSLYLTGRQFTYVSALTFGLVAWLVLSMLEFDRVNFVVGSIVLPWVVVFVVLIPVGIASGSDLGVFWYLFQSIEHLGIYAAAYMGAGLGAVALHRATERFTAASNWAPEPQRLTLGFLVIVVGVALAVTGGLHLMAMSASLSDVESGVEFRTWPSLNVTVDSEPTELRLTVTAPDESTYTQRISRGALSDGTATIPVAFHRLQTDPQAGTYHIEVTAISGLTVDTATYTVDEPPTPALVAVETAGPGETLHLDLPPGSRLLRPSPTDSETRVGVIIENQGDIVDRFSIRLQVDGERIASSTMPLEPSQQGGSVLPISEEDIERIHEEGERLTVEVGPSDREVRTEIELSKE